MLGTSRMARVPMSKRVFWTDSLKTPPGAGPVNSCRGGWVPRGPHKVTRETERGKGEESSESGHTYLLEGTHDSCTDSIEVHSILSGLGNGLGTESPLSQHLGAHNAVRGLWQGGVGVLDEAHETSIGGFHHSPVPDEGDNTGILSTTLGDMRSTHNIAAPLEAVLVLHSTNVAETLRPPAHVSSNTEHSEAERG